MTETNRIQQKYTELTAKDPGDESEKGSSPGSFVRPGRGDEPDGCGSPAAVVRPGCGHRPEPDLYLCRKNTAND